MTDDAFDNDEFTMAILRSQIAMFMKLFPVRQPERWMMGIAEEAGEVIGAYNKWQDGNTVKPKTKDDVLDEMSQLTAVLFMTAAMLDVQLEDFLAMVSSFLAWKSQEIRNRRALS